MIWNTKQAWQTQRHRKSGKQQALFHTSCAFQDGTCELLEPQSWVVNSKNPLKEKTSTQVDEEEQKKWKRNEKKWKRNEKLVTSWRSDFRLIFASLTTVGTERNNGLKEPFPYYLQLKKKHACYTAYDAKKSPPPALVCIQLIRHYLTCLFFHLLWRGAIRSSILLKLSHLCAFNTHTHTHLLDLTRFSFQVFITWCDVT